MMANDNMDASSAPRGRPTAEVEVLTAMVRVYPPGGSSPAPYDVALVASRSAPGQCELMGATESLTGRQARAVADALRAAGFEAAVVRRYDPDSGRCRAHVLGGRKKAPPPAAPSGETEGDAERPDARRLARALRCEQVALREALADVLRHAAAAEDLGRAARQVVDHAAKSVAGGGRCAAPGCERPSKVRGLCSACYHYAITHRDGATPRARAVWQAISEPYGAADDRRQP